MKKSVLFTCIILGSLLAFVFYTFLSTGFFREINNSDGYGVIAKIPLKGAEDLTISYEDEIMIVSQDDRAAKFRDRNRKGGLFLINLKDPAFTPVALKSKVPLYPHGISLKKIDSIRYQLLVVNHYRQHTIEKFELIRDSLIHLQTVADPLLISPNDVVILNEQQFYVTNDHGYTSRMGLLAENYLGLNVSNVVFYDGESFREVAGGIGYANGINISKDRKLLLVASPRKFSLRYYEIQEKGSLDFVRSLHVGSGIDNIELDPEGNLWMGSHPNLLGFTSYAAGKAISAPSEIIYVSKEGVAESVFVNDGSVMSASSVVAPFKEFLFVGTVMDDFLVVLRKKDEQ